MKTVTHACLSLALLAALAAAARADVLPVLLVVSPEGNAYRWNYSVQATAGITINAGDSFTFGDFAGLVPGSAQAPDGWQASVGIAAGGPSAPDLTFTYSGAALGGPLALGTFSAASAYSGHANAFFVAQVQAAGGGLTPWVVPVPVSPLIVPPPLDGGPVTSVPETPEPATLALAAAGLAALAGRRFVSRRRPN